MDITITHGPGNSAARIALGGGILKAAKRMISGESFFLNHFTADREGGEVWLATALPGDMMQYTLDQEKLIVQGGSYVASESGVNIDLGWQVFKSLLSGEGMFWIHLTGGGMVVLNSFGAIYPVEVDGEYIVDTGHIVAFQETLEFNITKAGRS